MNYNPQTHHRRSIRLRGYDYSRTGAYFVTLCTQNQACLFGDIENGKMQLNEAGKMMKRWYSELENKFPDIQCDEFVCMPNHVHFITITVGADLRVRPGGANPQPVRPGGANPQPAPCETMGEHTGSPLHRVVQWFKTMSTNEYIRGVKQNGWPSFPGKLWQRNYWEHIIRNEQESNRIREYIRNNPLQWELDKLHPATVGADLRVRPGGANPGMDTVQRGQTHRPAPAKIREPSAPYEHIATPPDNEKWMV